MQPHHHVKRVTRRLWQSLHCPTCILRLSSACFEREIPSGYHVGFATLPHLQKVLDLGHSVRFPDLRLCLHFWVVFSVCRIQFCLVAWQNPAIGSSELPYNDSFAKCVTCGFWLPPADNILPKLQTGLHSDTMWYDREYVARHIGEISVLWVLFLLLPPPVRSVRYPKCTANLHCVAVVIIEIWINLPPVLWCIRRWTQIEPGGRQSACHAITSSGCCSSHIGSP